MGSAIMTPTPRALADKTYIYRDNYWKAAKHWMLVCGDETSFVNYLDLAPPDVAMHNTRPYLMVTHEQARKINLLISPYYAAIIKMIQLKATQ
jgi:hypothetical protein